MQDKLPTINLDEIVKQMEEAKERLTWQGITANAVMLSPKLYKTLMPIYYNMTNGQCGMSFSGDPAILGMRIYNGGLEMPPDVDFLVFRGAGVRNFEEELRKAKWAEVREECSVTFYCTHCHFEYEDADPNARSAYRYCPHCGYRMENVTDDDE